MSAQDDHSPAGHERLLGSLERSGFHRSTHNGAQWELSPAGTRRHVYFRVEVDGDRRVYSIYVEEWRGGEGYEEEEFRSPESSDALAAIPRWVEWASEPFDPTAWERLRARFGLP